MRFYSVSAGRRVSLDGYDVEIFDNGALKIYPPFPLGEGTTLDIFDARTDELWHQLVERDGVAVDPNAPEPVVFDPNDVNLMRTVPHSGWLAAMDDALVEAFQAHREVTEFIVPFEIPAPPGLVYRGVPVSQAPIPAGPDELGVASKPSGPVGVRMLAWRSVHRPTRSMVERLAAGQIDWTNDNIHVKLFDANGQPVASAPLTGRTVTSDVHGTRFDADDVTIPSVTGATVKRCVVTDGNGDELFELPMPGGLVPDGDDVTLHMSPGGLFRID